MAYAIKKIRTVTTHKQNIVNVNNEALNKGSFRVDNDNE